MKIFPFLNSGAKLTKNIKLNRDGNLLTLFVEDSVLEVDLDNIRDGSSSLVTYKVEDKVLLPLYNFRELCQIFNCTAREFNKIFHTYGVMQIDKCNNDYFIKVFLPYNQTTLESDTDDYSELSFLNLEEINQLDLQFSYYLEYLKLTKEEDYINISFNFKQGSSFWNRPVHINYAGLSEPLKHGENKFKFKYLEGNDIYIGEPYSSYKGRIIPVKKFIHDK